MHVKPLAFLHDDVARHIQYRRTCFSLLHVTITLKKGYGKSPRHVGTNACNLTATIPEGIAVYYYYVDSGKKQQQQQYTLLQ